MSAITIIPALETMPRAVAIGRHAVGKLLLVALFTGLLGTMKFARIDGLVVLFERWPGWWQTGVVLAVISLFPAYRRAFLALAAAWWMVLVPPLDVGFFREWSQHHGAEKWVGFWPAVVLAIWLLAIGFARLVRRFPTSPVGRRPVLSLLVVLVGLLAAARLPLTGGAAFVITASSVVLGSCIWFFGYTVLDRSAKTATDLGWQARYWRPFWGFSGVPIGKGAAYLDRIEAQDEEQLAAVQLKGMKLLLWATVLYIIQAMLNRATGRPHVLGRFLAWLPVDLIPSYAQALEYHLAGHAYPWAVRWVALIVEFLRDVLDLAVWGHIVIAICRMAGFAAFRSTYRPLTSPTIAEFYNRVYYYFKELLATFFFYPCYLRYFKRYPRLRLFAATVAAAGLGNFIFHFLYHTDELIHRGLGEQLLMYHTYAVYALILGVAIGLSQLRSMARGRRPPTGWRKARAIAGVLFFYCLMSMFRTPTPSRSILHYGSYFLSLFWP